MPAIFLSRRFLQTVAFFLLCSISFAQTRRTKTAPTPKAPAPQQFEQIAAKANGAREAGKLDEAIQLYQQGITLNPKWNEGWWYLATLLYEKDQYSLAAKAFNNSAALNPQSGAPIVMLGLCEFRLAQYDEALAHIQQGRKIGLADNPDLSLVMRYHEGMLLTLKSEFEMAEKIFDVLSYENVNNEQLFIAHGLAVLRIPSLPSKIDPTRKDYEMIRRIGYAQHLVAQLNKADGQSEYQRLVNDYPKVPGVQYAYGRFLLYSMRNDDVAIEAFKREIENSPGHALARLQISYIKLKNKEPQDGVKYAEEAAALNPRLPLAHFILGRLYFDNGDTQRSIDELEAAQKMLPEEPKIYFSLARAYAKVGRKTDADNARATFVRLNAAAESAAAQGQVKGEAIEEGEEKKPRPDKP